MLNRIRITASILATVFFGRFSRRGAQPSPPVGVVFPYVALRRVLWPRVGDLPSSGPKGRDVGQLDKHGRRRRPNAGASALTNLYLTVCLTVQTIGLRRASRLASRTGNLGHLGDGRPWAARTEQGATCPFPSFAPSAARQVPRRTIHVAIVAAAPNAENGLKSLNWLRRL
jgi:hypothetical protein